MENGKNFIFAGKGAFFSACGQQKGDENLPKIEKNHFSACFCQEYGYIDKKDRIRLFSVKLNVKEKE